MGGFLSDAVGRAAWLGFARDVRDGLTTVRQVIKEGTGGWDSQYEAYQCNVERLTQELDVTLDAF